jgi:hypothetical protein
VSKGGRVEGWKGGRVEGWKGGRVVNMEDTTPFEDELLLGDAYGHFAGCKTTQH